MQLIVNKNLNRLLVDLGLHSKLNQRSLIKNLRTTSVRNDQTKNGDHSESTDSNQLMQSIESNYDDLRSPKADAELSEFNEEYYMKIREKAVVELKKTYLSKLESMTPWRKEFEDKLSRRRVPLPFSLTGFGDCSKDTRIWVQRIRRSLDEMINSKAKQTYFDKLPASVQYFLENKPDKLDSKYKLIVDRFNSEKEKLIAKLTLMESAPEVRKAINMPFNFKENIKKTYDLVKTNVDEKRVANDKDYDNYMKHHHLIEYVSNRFGGKITNFEVNEEMIALSNTIWHRDYGSENTKIKPSNVPCSGCGSNLHCTSSNIPGYVPYEKFSELSRRKLRVTLCQRCDFLKKYNVSLNVNVDPKDYEDVISKIRHRDGLVLMMVDATDFPCSLNPKIFDLIGKERRLLIVVNKIDLLPKDGNNYLSRIKESIIANTNLDRKVNPKDIILVSAMTGFGIDNLISSIYQINNGQQDVYLLGCTNVGKSTLFNHLLQSEFCRLRESDILQRATTSIWPGTTLNLLKFPIRPLAAWEKEIRKRRLFLKRIRKSLDEIELRKSMKYQSEDKKLFMRLEDRIGDTSQKELPFKIDSHHPLAKIARSTANKPFSGKHLAFEGASFLYDTPGVIFEDQIISLLTTEELLKTLPRKTIRPRTFTLQPFQTLFIGGLGRLDLLHSKESILVTVFASDYLPVHIVNLEEALRFYELYLNTDFLSVPSNDGHRIETWPSLVSKDFHIKNDRTTNEYADVKVSSFCDIVFSSAGWLSLSLKNGTECIVKAYTPEGKFVYFEQGFLSPRN